MFCKHCEILMKPVMRFENGNSYRLYRCPKCFSETKPRRFFFNDVKASMKNTDTYFTERKLRNPIKNKNKKRRGK